MAEQREVSFAHEVVSLIPAALPPDGEVRISVLQRGVIEAARAIGVPSMKSALCAALFLLAGVAPASAATIINFDDLPGGPAGTTLTIGEVTFASPVELFIGPLYTDDGVTNVLCSRTAATFGCESDLTVSFAAPVSGFGVSVSGANTTAATIHALATLADGSLETITFDGFEPFTSKVLSFGTLQVRSVTFSTTDPQGFSFDDFTFGSAVPEPATWALMISGFGLAGMALRRRQARIAQPA